MRDELVSVHRERASSQDRSRLHSLPSTKAGDSRHYMSQPVSVQARSEIESKRVSYQRKIDQKQTRRQNTSLNIFDVQISQPDISRDSHQAIPTLMSKPISLDGKVTSNENSLKLKDYEFLMNA